MRISPSAHSVAIAATLLVATVLVLQPVSAQRSPDSGLPSAVPLPDDLAAVLRGYEAAWSRRDPVALADLFTPDGYVLRPGRPPAHGREAILAAYANSGGPLSLRAYAYEAEGPVGYIIGGYASDPGRDDVGKFVLALRRALRAHGSSRQTSTTATRLEAYRHWEAGNQ
jgi:hypothetical protein